MPDIVEVGNASGDVTIRLDGNAPSISVKDDHGDVAVRITTQALRGGAGSGPTSGLLEHTTELSKPGQAPSQRLTADYQLVEAAATVKPRVDINGVYGTITLAGVVEETAPLPSGSASESGSFAKKTIRKIKVRLGLDGESGAIEAGGNDVIGELRLDDAAGGINVRLRGNGEATFGGRGSRGRIALARAAGDETVRLNGEQGDIHIGGHGTDGDLKIYGANGALRIHLKGNDGDIILKNADGALRIQMKGDEGDIILSNADFAEDFDVAEPIEPGTVVVLDEMRRVRPCTRPYDRAVVGVVAGAGDCKPAIIADRRAGATGRQAVSLLGKAFCKVEASAAPIAVGDLLTTSRVPGHAMKAVNPGQAIGALVGKALAPLPIGQGFIPILVLVR